MKTKMKKENIIANDGDFQEEFRIFMFILKRYVKKYLQFIIQYLFDEISNVPWIASE